MPGYEGIRAVVRGYYSRGTRVLEPWNEGIVPEYEGIGPRYESRGVSDFTVKGLGTSQ